MNTVEFWRGDFGKDYLQRNQPDYRARVPFWTHILEQTGASSFLDVGCNAGWNLEALRHISEEYVMSGIDVNREALDRAQTKGFDVHEGRADEIVTRFGPGAAEMVITSGVLIHIAPEDLTATMQAIVDVSSHWVVAVEYESDPAREILYRGHTGKCWARPYGRLYEALGLSIVEYGEAQGFDKCQFVLLEKT